MNVKSQVKGEVGCQRGTQAWVWVGQDWRSGGEAWTHLGLGQCLLLTVCGVGEEEKLG